MRIVHQILFFDNMRKLHRQGYDLWRQNQRQSRCREFGKYCKDEQDWEWGRYLFYRRCLVQMGIDTGDWEFDDIKYISKYPSHIWDSSVCE